ncbi:hypothetical protein D1872_217620 [compost metagenome]
MARGVFGFDRKAVLGVRRQARYGVTCRGTRARKERSAVNIIAGYPYIIRRRGPGQGYGRIGFGGDGKICGSGRGRSIRHPVRTVHFKFPKRIAPLRPPLRPVHPYIPGGLGFKGDFVDSPVPFRCGVNGVPLMIVQGGLNLIGFSVSNFPVQQDPVYLTDRFQIHADPLRIGING